MNSQLQAARVTSEGVGFFGMDEENEMKRK